jgi:hypothetical protein
VPYLRLAVSFCCRQYSDRRTVHKVIWRNKAGPMSLLRETHNWDNFNGTRQQTTGLAMPDPSSPWAWHVAPGPVSALSICTHQTYTTWHQIGSTEIFSALGVLVREQDAAGGRTVSEPVVIDDGNAFLPEAPGSNLHIVQNILPCSRAIRSSSLSQMYDEIQIQLWCRRTNCNRVSVGHSAGFLLTVLSEWWLLLAEDDTHLLLCLYRRGPYFTKVHVLPRITIPAHHHSLHRYYAFIILIPSLSPTIIVSIVHVIHQLYPHTGKTYRPLDIWYLRIAFEVAGGRASSRYWLSCTADYCCRWMHVNIYTIYISIHLYIYTSILINI